MFAILGLKPALGRFLGGSDDLKSGAHPVAVFCYDYWTARFGCDPRVVGKTFRLGGGLYQLSGYPPLRSWNNFWLRISIQLRPGVSPAPVRDRPAAVYYTIQKGTRKIRDAHAYANASAL